jgi:hypothetical protein
MTSVQPIEFRWNGLRDAPVDLLGVQFLDALASQGNQGLQPVRAWCVPPWGPRDCAGDLVRIREPGEDRVIQMRLKLQRVDARYAQTIPTQSSLFGRPPL